MEPLDFESTVANSDKQKVVINDYLTNYNIFAAINNFNFSAVHQRTHFNFFLGFQMFYKYAI